MKRGYVSIVTFICGKKATENAFRTEKLRKKYCTCNIKEKVSILNILKPLSCKITNTLNVLVICYGKEQNRKYVRQIGKILFQKILKSIRFSK